MDNLQSQLKDWNLRRRYVCLINGYLFALNVFIQIYVHVVWLCEMGGGGG